MNANNNSKQCLLIKFFDFRNISSDRLYIVGSYLLWHAILKPVQKNYANYSQKTKNIFFSNLKMYLHAHKM